MGLLQPGIPLPSLLPKVWPIIVIGLTDDFFTIPLKKRIEKFAFIFHSYSNVQSAKQYH